MKNIGLILLLLAFAFACAEEEEVAQSPQRAENFEDLRVSDDFNWINGQSGLIEVELSEDPTFPMDLEGQRLWVLNRRQERLAFAFVDAQNKATFNLALPDEQANYAVQLEATGEIWPLEWKSKLKLNMVNPFGAGLNKAFGKSHGLAKSNSGTNLLGNPGFETDLLPSNIAYAGNYTPASSPVDDGRWRSANADLSQAVTGGSKRILEGNSSNYIWQNVSVNAGDSIYFTCDFSGLVAVYLVYYADASASRPRALQNAQLNSNPAGIRSVVPEGCSVVSAVIFFGDGVPSGDYIDNAFLSNPPAISDSDNDGVADDADAFPNDPTRAYVTYFPNEGWATIMFEDLWPSKGDYDFNDMVINTQIVYSYDAAGNRVSAEYTVALDAVGAGIQNGLAVRDLNRLGDAFSADAITSVEGAARKDPAVDNGVIVFDQPSDLQSTYYTNTRPDRMATPDTARFKVNYNGTYSSFYFAPDFYIFRSSDRGHEVHMPGFPGTQLADPNLYNPRNEINGDYLSEEGLPWGMALVWNSGDFEIPLEGTDFLEAYPDYALYLSSNRQSNADWYQYPAPNKTLAIGAF